MNSTFEINCINQFNYFINSRLISYQTSEINLLKIILSNSTVKSNFIYFTIHHEKPYEFDESMNFSLLWENRKKKKKKKSEI